MKIRNVATKLPITRGSMLHSVRTPASPHVTKATNQTTPYALTFPDINFVSSKLFNLSDLIMLNRLAYDAVNEKITSQWKIPKAVMLPTY